MQRKMRERKEAEEAAEREAEARKATKGPNLDVLAGLRNRSASSAGALGKPITQRSTAALRAEKEQAEADRKRREAETREKAEAERAKKAAQEAKKAAAKAKAERFLKNVKK